MAQLVDDIETLRVILDLENRKYSTDYTMDLFDPSVNACFRVEPVRAFGIDVDDFTGSPTRWTFG